MNMESIYEYGVAGRLLAAVADVHRARPAGHGLRRRDRARAQSGSGRGDEGGRLGDREPRAEMDRIQGISARTWSAGTSAMPIRIHAAVTGVASARHVHGQALRNTLKLVMEEGGFALLLGQLRRRSALLDGRPERAAPDRALYARLQRHAVCHPAGLQFRRPVLRLSEGQLRRPLRRGRGGQREDAEHRPALPAGRAARPRRGAGRFLDYVQSKPDVWVARRIDIARHWRERFPYRPGLRPSRLSQTEFVETFGGVFEHSPLSPSAPPDAAFAPRMIRRRAFRAP